MKKFLVTLLMIPLLLGIIVAPAHAAPLIDASAAVMVDASTGQVIYEQNAQQKLPIASISKLLTAIVIEDEVHSNQITGTPRLRSIVARQQSPMIPTIRLLVYKRGSHIRFVNC